MLNNSQPACDFIVLSHVQVDEKSKGVRFDIPKLGQFATGFVVRFDGKLYAYVNQCAHVSIELDWNQGEFFDASQQYIICATHGAHYQPITGYCVMGPCNGKRLKPLPVTEQVTEHGYDITIDLRNIA